MTDADILRAWTLKSSLNFTRYFFKHNNDMKFIIGKHHKLICDALDDVLNGKCNKLIINLPPRYGKTELAVKFYWLQLNEGINLKQPSSSNFELMLFNSGIAGASRPSSSSSGQYKVVPLSYGITAYK